jgi:hypothetical protein
LHVRGWELQNIFSWSLIWRSSAKMCQRI